VENQSKNVKRWNDKTKSLFATILDHGGPALAKIVTEKLSGPSLQTMYRSARSSFAIPVSLQERALQRAAHFYSKIGYKGGFVLAVDATAIIPTLRVQGNRIVGLATENRVVVSTAQDIINIVQSADSVKAKQANAFVLTPLQEHIPTFILAIAPVYKGQDFALVRHWINQVMLWSGRNDMMVICLGADGDSKVRKFYIERFEKSHGDHNDVISIDYESFQFNAVIEDLGNLVLLKRYPR